ncbi:MAG: helix-turn-helix transcriptional regulator [Lachnospiraceae bacterium]|nr:helix-turn-helix transcriptional regulator [Lachnospiraceae bacterium]
MNAPTYKPLTATPYKHNETYTEMLPANPELAKYIRCYWGSENPYLQKEEHTVAGIVIPDTCVDIIYNIDHTDNTISSGFCGINDASFYHNADRKYGHLISTFAIRFYAWGVYAFSQDSLRDTLNGYYDVQSRFMWLDRVLRQQLFERYSMAERATIAETAFLKRLDTAGKDSPAGGVLAGSGISAVGKVRRNNTIDCAVAQMLLHKGNVSAAQLARECFVSSRQLERLFHEYVGITPKKLCNLVRYQCLWGELMSNPWFHVADAVYRYGYTDQSHLMREFKRYHAMDIKQAKKCAYDNVGNIQYIHGRW